uniref:Uncharacterized protein n=1 Tax=Arundo donax TaxID=35708 RepID=A0A0A8ZS77_ARUDO
MSSALLLPERSSHCLNALLLIDALWRGLNLNGHPCDASGLATAMCSAPG